ncbi:MAG: leucyl aminopeptidase, partial [Longimicrobiales bacterium]
MADVKIAAVQGSAGTVQTPLLAVQLFERDLELNGSAADLDTRTGGLLKRVLTAGDFTGKKDESLVLYPPVGSVAAERILLVGVGKRADYTMERLRRGVGTTIRQAEKLRVKAVALVLDQAEHSSERLGPELAARGAVDAAVLACWDFREYKSTGKDQPTPRPVEQVTLVAGSAEEQREFEQAARSAEISARAANLARELATRPGNEVTPSYLANVAENIGKKYDMKVTVLDRAQIRSEGMGALLAVAAGSEEEPRFIVLEYRKGPNGKAPLVLIGKGVTFDSGGISIKPAERMEDMKYDMSGAAAVLAAMSGIAELGLEANVVALVPSTENMPSGSAFKPGDVIRAHSGKTIEIVNTDAEGRLILADALSYAQRFKPAAIIDAATLTGAVVVALGNQAIGLMGNDGDLIDEVRAAGQRVCERCWPMPLWDEYRELIDSNIADMKNSGGRAAGTITAGWFLKEFAGETPWVHL